MTEQLFDPTEHVRAMVGTHYRTDDYYLVGREKVREYARAVQDDNRVHWDVSAAAALGYTGLVAPLTFSTLVGILAQQRLLESIAQGFDLSQILQTDQALESSQAIVAGDQLTFDVSLHSVRQVMGRDVLVTKNVVSNQHNDLLQTMYTTLMIGRAGDTDDKIVDAAHNLMMNGVALPASSDSVVPAPTVPKPAYDPPIQRTHSSSANFKFDEVSVGDVLPTRIIRLTRGDLVNFAGVAGDANPIHWSDEFAKLAGLTDVLAHGMLTMGLGAGYITSWLGDPGAVTEYIVRFTSPVSVGETGPADIEFTGKIKSLDPANRTAVIALNATFEGKRILGHRATATVQLT